MPPRKTPAENSAGASFFPYEYDAKQINEEREAAEEAVEDVAEETAEEAVEAEAEDTVEA